jgi:hypothetical protein
LFWGVMTRGRTCGFAGVAGLPRAEARGQLGVVPTGLISFLMAAYPALKRGANKHCAYGAGSLADKHCGYGVGAWAEKRRGYGAGSPADRHCAYSADLWWVRAGRVSD